MKKKIPIDRKLKRCMKCGRFPIALYKLQHIEQGLTKSGDSFQKFSVVYWICPECLIRSWKPEFIEAILQNIREGKNDRFLPHFVPKGSIESYREPLKAEPGGEAEGTIRKDEVIE